MSVDLLVAAARALDDLCAKVVFLGGASIGLWITDPAARPPRVTYDVDVVAEVTTLGAYTRFQEQLRARRFREAVESGVICRWRHIDTGLILDAVPLRHELAGFSGRWLRSATAAAVDRVVSDGLVIRAVPAEWLLVVKFEAFADRGNDDILSSRDFEDIILLVDGRAELIGEFARLPVEARRYVRGHVDRLLEHHHLHYGVEGALATSDGRARAEAVTLPRLRELAGYSLS